MLKQAIFSLPLPLALVCATMLGTAADCASEGEGEDEPVCDTDLECQVDDATEESESCSSSDACAVDEACIKSLQGQRCMLIEGTGCPPSVLPDAVDAEDVEGNDVTICVDGDVKCLEDGTCG